MEFVVALVEHLAWPLLVGGALIGFRRSLGALVSRLDSWEGLGQKFSFGRKLVETGKRAERATSEVDAGLTGSNQEVPPEDDDRFSTLAKDAAENPSYSITAAWDMLEDALRDLLGSAAKELGQNEEFRLPRNQVVAIRSLRGRGYFNDNFISAVEGLRQLRNKVAHGQHKPTPSEAVSYVASASELSRVSQMLAAIVAKRSKPDTPRPS
jgi:hypothetical protein